MSTLSLYLEARIRIRKRIEVIGMIRICIKVTSRIRIRIRNTGCKPGEPLQKLIRNSYPKMLIRGVFKETVAINKGCRKELPVPYTELGNGVSSIFYNIVTVV